MHPIVLLNRRKLFLGGLRRKRMDAESLGYNELEILEALSKEGCPVCSILADSDQRYFFWFLHEGHLEPTVLREVTRSLGFCVAHADYLIQSGAVGSELASVHHHLARELRSILAAHLGRRNRKVDPKTILGKGGQCPACRSRDDRADRTAFFLSKLINDPSSAHQYVDPGVLCIPHLRQVAPLLNEATLAHVLTIHEGALKHSTLDVNRLPPGEASKMQSQIITALRQTVGHDMGLGNFLPLPGDLSEPPSFDILQNLRQYILRTDICPICLAVGQAWLTWTAWLEAATQRVENTEDVLPTCGEHVWALLRFAGPTLVHRTVKKALDGSLAQIRLALSKLQEEPTRVISKRALIRMGRDALAQDFLCPVCGHLGTIRDRVLLLLFVLLGNRRQRDNFEEGFGLCSGHFRSALALNPEPWLLDFLCQAQKTKLSLIQWETEEYSRKSAWEARPKPKGMEQVQIGRNLGELQALALKTTTYWQKPLCGRCAGNDSPQRCRLHLIEEISQGMMSDPSPHASLVDSIAEHIKTHARSFRYEYHGTQTEEDTAALISAVGWCSGWQTFLSIVGL